MVPSYFQSFFFLGVNGDEILCHQVLASGPQYGLWLGFFQIASEFMMWISLEIALVERFLRFQS